MVRLAVVVLLIPAVAGAAPFTVTSTADSGPGSLRDAITQANAAQGADTISFAITGTAPYTITLASPLPAVTDSVTIDATTQTSYAGAPLVMLDGANAIGTALTLAPGSTNSVVRGLAIGHTLLAALQIGAHNCTISDNYFGTDTTGVVVARNQTGVWIRPLSAVEVPSASIYRNVIGGNTAYGIDVETGVEGLGITENKIGIGADGATPVANHTAGVYVNGGEAVNIFNNVIAESQDGILITSAMTVDIQNNTIGADAFGMPLPVDYGIEVRGGTAIIHEGAIGDAQIAGISLQTDSNVVEFVNLVGNQRAIELVSSVNTINQNTITGNVQGVYGVGSGRANLITRNSIHDNGDAGLEGSLYPDVAVLTSATINGATLAIAGSMTSTANTGFTVELFDNPSCDPSGAGEGKTFIGLANVMTDASSMGTIATTLNATVAEGDAITATAMGSSILSSNNFSTSAFSACVKACPVIAVAPASLAINVDVPVSQTITASGGIAGYTFAVTAGALPDNVTLAADGTLSGTPDSIANATFTITATDSKGCTGSQTYTVQPACPSITLAPATLPAATLGQPYTQQLTASGGAGSYNFTAMGLPSWIALLSGGTLTGTPDAVGSTTFAVSATEPSDCATNTTYTLVVESGAGPDDAGVDAAPADAAAPVPDGGTAGETGNAGGCCSAGGRVPGGAFVLAALCMGFATRRRRRTV